MSYISNINNNKRDYNGHRLYSASGQGPQPDVRSPEDGRLTFPDDAAMASAPRTISRAPRALQVRQSLLSI